jgi:hypothetical protein
MRFGAVARRARRALPAALAVIAVLPAAASAATGPDSRTQPLTDGCQRSPVGLLTFTSPEWVYVNSDPIARVVEGTARSTHTAGGDLPQGHDWYDLNSNIDVDPQYTGLLGGDPTLKTGNYAGNGEETGRLHVEWETGSAPPFVWPTEADRVKLWGSWIWDCGHWGQSFRDPDYFLPGSGETPFSTNVPGERTEFHPMQAMVVTRANPYLPQVQETEADVYISNDGTLAHAQEQCALEHPATKKASYGPDYSACVQDPAKRHQVINDRNYTFFVPAPPKPTQSATLSYRVVDMTHGNGPQEQVQVLSNGIQVTIPFQDFADTGGPLTYGKSFFVRWQGSSKPPLHLQAQFQTLKVIHSLDPNLDRGTQTGKPPGEYNLYLDLNGYWKFLNEWAPGLGAVSDGQTFTLGQRVDFYVQGGKGVRVFVHGRECDLPKINPCPSTTEVSDDNDLPGDAIDQFGSAQTAVGTHTLTAPSGNYQLTYTIRRVTP